VKSENTRKFILEKAAPVFNKKGFEGTSLADLEEATGLTRGALYGHFPDKEAIAGDAFAWSVKKVKSLMRDELRAVPTYGGKLCRLLDFFGRYVLEPPIPGGCPLVNTAVEADDHHLSMRPVVSAEIMRVVNFFASLIRKGIRAGEFRKDTNPRELAYTFFCAIEGAILFSRVEGSSEPMNIIVNHCKNKLDQITCNKNG